MANLYHSRGFAHDSKHYRIGENKDGHHNRYNKPMDNSGDIKRGQGRYKEQYGYYAKNQAKSDLKHGRYADTQHNSSGNEYRRRFEYDDRRRRTSQETDYNRYDLRRDRCHEGQNDYRKRDDSNYLNGLYDRYYDRPGQTDRHRRDIPDSGKHKYGIYGNSAYERDRIRDRDKDGNRDKSRDSSGDRLDNQHETSRYRGGHREELYGVRNKDQELPYRAASWHKDYDPYIKTRTTHAEYNYYSEHGEGRSHSDDYEKKVQSNPAEMSYDKNWREYEYNQEYLAPDYEEPGDALGSKRDSGYSEESEKPGESHRVEAQGDAKDQIDKPSHIYSVPIDYKGSKISACNKRCLIITSSVIGLILAIGIGVGLFFIFRDTAHQDSITVRGMMELEDQHFKDDFTDLSSEASQLLISSFCDAIETSVTDESSSIRTLYQECVVTNLQAGSVIVTFEVMFAQYDLDLDLAQKTERAIQVQIDQGEDGAFREFGTVIIIIIVVEDPNETTTKLGTTTTTPTPDTTNVVTSEQQFQTTSRIIVSSSKATTLSLEQPQKTSTDTIETTITPIKKTKTLPETSSLRTMTSPKLPETTRVTHTPTTEHAETLSVSSPLITMATSEQSDITSVTNIPSIEKTETPSVSSPLTTIVTSEQSDITSVTNTPSILKTETPSVSSPLTTLVTSEQPDITSETDTPSIGKTETPSVSSLLTTIVTSEQPDITSEKPTISKQNTATHIMTSPSASMVTPQDPDVTSGSRLLSSYSPKTAFPSSASPHSTITVTAIGDNLTSMIVSTIQTTTGGTMTEKDSTVIQESTADESTTGVGSTDGRTTIITDAPTTIPDYDNCKNVTCFNNGSCNDEDGPFICECKIGFTGVFCETAFRGCESNPCQNGGTCVELEPAGYYCICALCNCANNWAGMNCEKNVTKCPFEWTNMTTFAIPDPNDCTRYISCINEQQFGSRPCNPGLVFSFDLMENADDPCDVYNDCGDPILLPTTPPPIIPCDNNTCEHDATCTDTEFGFLCECMEDFTGRYCETELITCDEADKCLNGGICEDTPEGFYCRCHELFDGTFCEKPFDPCTPNPCGLGTCVPSEDRLIAQCFCAACDCANDGAGQYCEFDMSACDWRTGFFPEPDDCSRYIRCVGGEITENGTCDKGDVASLDSNIRCANPANPDHTTCSNAPVIIPTPPPILSCSDVSCLNGATCEDTVAGFICHCAINRIGRLCESEFYTCDDIECQNGAECTDEDEGFYCNCTKGFIGDRCESVRLPCDDQPCKNGGTCVNNGTDFYCICTACECAENFITSDTCDPDLLGCEGELSTSLPHPFNCSLGIQCVDGHPEIIECDEGEVYIPTWWDCGVPEHPASQCFVHSWPPS